MRLIDTHCHLDAPEFGVTPEELVQQALGAGVHTIVVPAVESANFAKVHTICEQNRGCAPAYGIHPMYVENATPGDLDNLREYLQHGKPIAVGEIGLDFFVENYDQKKQELYFSAQLEIAQEFDLPVLLHIRKAHDKVLKYLRRIKVRGGIAHAFNGSPQQAAEFIKLGFKFGFGGAMTYSRATRLRDLASTLPLGSIVLETDAPDIPPSFLQRGQPNRPDYLPQIAQTLAELRGLPLQEIARATTENALSVLPKLAPYLTVVK